MFREKILDKRTRLKISGYVYGKDFSFDDLNSAVALENNSSSSSSSNDNSASSSAAAQTSDITLTNISVESEGILVAAAVSEGTATSSNSSSSSSTAAAANEVEEDGELFYEIEDPTLFKSMMSLAPFSGLNDCLFEPLVD